MTIGRAGRESLARRSTRIGRPSEMNHAVAFEAVLSFTPGVELDSRSER